MLTKLELRNFQRHRSLEIELEQITSIVGRTDAGKSSILRALGWLCTNRPQGDDFRHWDEREVGVRLTFDGGRRIVRRRGPALNSYSLDGQQYRAFGTEPPQPILEALGIDTVSFSGQFDPAFWFSLTPGQVARELNRVVNLELIDEATAHAAAEVRKTRTRQELVAEQLAEARSQQERLAWVEQAAERLESLEASETALAALDGEIEALGSLAARIRETRRTAALRPPSAAQAEVAREKVNEADTEISAIEGLLAEIAKAEEQLCRAQEKAKAEAKSLKDAVGKICPICGTAMTK